MLDIAIRPMTILAVVMAVTMPFTAGVTAESLSPDRALATALAGPQRSAKFVARDVARRPAQELAFFGLRPDMSVLEIWPGGGYWTEILAPVLKDHGRYTIALPPSRDAATPLSATAIGQKLAADPAIYGKATLVVAGKGSFELAPPSSVDLVVSFRNLHNWMAGGYAPDMFAAFFRALKPGGVLGIEEHRGNRTITQDPRAADGYVTQDTIIDLAKAAGFRLVGSSELNANPKDTANWPRGVWTLPPDLALGDTDKAKYIAVGEADNAVLKFAKP